MAVLVAAVELDHLWIGTKRACLSGERLAGSNHAFRCTTLLDPLLDCCRHAELVCGLSAAAVDHIKNKK